MIAYLERGVKPCTRQKTSRYQPYDNSVHFGFDWTQFGITEVSLTHIVLQMTLTSFLKKKKRKKTQNKKNHNLFS